MGKIIVADAGKLSLVNPKIPPKAIFLPPEDKAVKKDIISKDISVFEKFIDFIIEMFTGDI